MFFQKAADLSFLLLQLVGVALDLSAKMVTGHQERWDERYDEQR